MSACDLVCALMLALGVDAETAERHAFAAEQAADESQKVTADLLLAVVRHETRFRPHVVSKVRGKLFCGVGGTQAGRSWKRCKQQQRLDVGYRLLRDELAYWIKRRRGDLAWAIRSHGCGNAARPSCGSYGGRKRPYDVRVLESLRRIRARRVP